MDTEPLIKHAWQCSESMLCPPPHTHTHTQFTIIAIILAASLATDLPPVFDLFVRPLVHIVENFTIIRAQTMNFSIEQINSLETIFSGTDEVIGLILVGLPGNDQVIGLTINNCNPLSVVSVLVCVSCGVSRVLSLSLDQHGGHRQVSH